MEEIPATDNVLEFKPIKKNDEEKKKAIEKALISLSANYQARSGEEALAVWQMALEDYGKESIAEALKKIAKTRNSPFMPSTGEFIAVIEENKKQKIISDSLDRQINERYDETDRPLTKKEAKDIYAKMQQILSLKSLAKLAKDGEVKEKNTKKENFVVVNEVRKQDGSIAYFESGGHIDKQLFKDSCYHHTGESRPYNIQQV